MKLRNVITYLTAAAIAVGTVAAGTSVTNARAEETSGTEYKIFCAGDSITHGYINGDNGYRKYLCHYLQQQGISYDMVGPENSWSNEATYNWNGTTITYDPQHCGYSGYAIQRYGGRSGLYETIFGGSNLMTTYDPDIVLLMIGTNDLLDARLDKTSVNDSVTDSTTALERLENLVDTVISNMDSTDILILGSIPDIDTSVCPSWVSNYQWVYGVDANDSAALQAKVDECIDAYNAGVKSLAAEKKSAGYNVAFCDINSAVDMKTGLHDGCHPNESGYAEMGKLWANTLIECLDEEPIAATTTTTTTTTTTITTTTDEAELAEISLHIDYDGFFPAYGQNFTLEAVSEQGNDLMFNASAGSNTEIVELSPGLVKWSCIGSDSIVVSGLPDGEYELNSDMAYGYDGYTEGCSVKFTIEDGMISGDTWHDMCFVNTGSNYIELDMLCARYTTTTTTTTTTTEKTTTTTETTTTATTTSIATTDDTKPTTTETTTEVTTTTTKQTTSATSTTTTTSATTTEPVITGGDVNDDGKVSMVDIVWLKKYLVGIVEKSEVNIQECDLDGNGTVNIFDAVRLLKFLVRII